MKYKKAIWIGSILIILLATFIVEKTFNLEEPQQQTFVALSAPGDFQNDVEGTFEMNIKGTKDDLLNHFGFLPDYVIIKHSQSIEGLKIIYSLNHKFIEGGLPKIKSSPVELFDNQPHKFYYTFKKDVGQRFIFDGQEIAISSYDPAIGKNMITGNVINIPYDLPEANLAVIQISPKALD